MSTTIIGPDGNARCRWCAAAPEFLGYHDTKRPKAAQAGTQDSLCCGIVAER